MTFPRHGRVSARIEGQLLVWEASGPFNAEFFEWQEVENTPLYRALAERGPWAILALFHESALITPDALALLRRTLPARAATYRKVASAWVIGPDVDGHRLLDDVVASISTDIPRRVFDSESKARRWLGQMLLEA